MSACNGDRLLNLCLHRFGLMGSEQKRIYRRLLRPGFTVVDVGANQGLYSLLFSTLAGPEGRVFSFEPDAALFATLQKNCQQNRSTNIKCYNCALGTKDETRSLYHSRVNSGDNRLTVSERPDWFYEVEVKTAALDSLLGDAHIDFIKIDVQGWEFEVLKGMAGILKNNPAASIYFEFWPFGLRRAGTEPAQMLEYLREHGFTLFDLADSSTGAVADTSSFCAKFGAYDAKNILAQRQIGDPAPDPPVDC
jgi:FkbM family methyltransferase